MKICNNCGASINSDAKFCSSCGADASGGMDEGNFNSQGMSECGSNSTSGSNISGNVGESTYSRPVDEHPSYVMVCACALISGILGVYLQLRFLQEAIVSIFR